MPLNFLCDFCCFFCGQTKGQLRCASKVKSNSNSNILREFTHAHSKRTHLHGNGSSATKEFESAFVQSNPLQSAINSYKTKFPLIPLTIKKNNCVQDFLFSKKFPKWTSRYPWYIWNISHKCSSIYTFCDNNNIENCSHLQILLPVWNNISLLAYLSLFGLLMNCCIVVESECIYIERERKSCCALPSPWHWHCCISCLQGLFSGKYIKQWLPIFVLNFEGLSESYDGRRAYIFTY